MTFLAKLGGFLAKGIALLAGLGPLIQPWLGSNAAKVEGGVTTAVNDLTSVGQIVLTAETLLQGPGTGAQKLANATPLVAQIVKTSELISGHQIGNEDLFVTGCGKITSGVADVLNSLKADNVKSSGQPITVPAVTVTPVTPAAPVAPSTPGPAVSNPNQ